MKLSPMALCSINTSSGLGLSRSIVSIFKTSGPPVFSILIAVVIFEQSFHYYNLE